MSQEHQKIPSIPSTVWTIGFVALFVKEPKSSSLQKVQDQNRLQSTSFTWNRLSDHHFVEFDVEFSRGQDRSYYWNSLVGYTNGNYTKFIDDNDCRHNKKRVKRDGVWNLLFCHGGCFIFSQFIDRMVA